MSETRFTPGPWRFDCSGDTKKFDISTRNSSWSERALIFDGNLFRGSWPENLANLRLAASAPDLYAACEAAREFLLVAAKDLAIPGSPQMRDKLGNALAKAKGEDPTPKTQDSTKESR